MFYVYKIHNLINDKIYVGKSKNVNDRWAQHLMDAKASRGSILHRAINKYGADNFVVSIIQELTSEEEAFEQEKFWISYYKTNVYRHGNKFGYNLTDGGDGRSGYVPSEETKSKLSISNMGQKRSAATSENNNRAKLTETEVIEIKMLLAQGYKTMEIAEKYGVIERTIRNIRYGKTWRHIK
jgi:group I intron endonuclease